MRKMFAFPLLLSALIFVYPVLPQNTNSSVSAESVSPSQQPRVITLRILMGNGTWFIASQREHGVINIEAQKWSLNISPHCYEGGNVIAEITGRANGHLFAERLEINKQAPIEAIKNNALAGIALGTIQVIDIRPAKSIIMARGDGSGSGSSECCISCDGIRVCGCAVEATCGNCCAGSCCGLGVGL